MTPLPDHGLFKEAIQAREEKHRTATHELVERVKDTDPRLACDILELSILHNNIVSLYQQTLIQFLDRWREDRQ